MIEAVAAVLGALVAGVVGYYLGKSKERQQFLYEQRAKTVVDIRTKLREIQQGFLSWSAPAWQRRLNEELSRRD